MYSATDCNVDTLPSAIPLTFLFPTFKIISVLGGYSMLYSQATSGADKTSQDVLNQTRELILILDLEGERSPNLVGRTGRDDVVQSLGVESKTEGRFHTGTEGLRVTKGQNASIVDLGLHKGSRVKVSLGANLEGNT